MAKSQDEAQRMDAPKRSTSESAKRSIYITGHVKYNGTFYRDTVTEVDDATARKLIDGGHAREATKEEIDEANARYEDQRSVKVETMKALGLEPAVDSDGNEIPGSYFTRETKLRNDEDNTIAGATVNDADELDEADNPRMNENPDVREAKSANAPDTTDAAATRQASKGRRI